MGGVEVGPGRSAHQVEINVKPVARPDTAPRVACSFFLTRTARLCGKARGVCKLMRNKPQMKESSMA